MRSRRNIRDLFLRSIEITDPMLLDELQQNYSKYGFIRRNAIYRIKKLETAKKLDRQLVIVKELWSILIADAIRHLKSEDKREPIKEERPKRKPEVVYGLNDLQEYMERFHEFEPTLYGTDHYYRDHVIHVFRVWMLGNLILKNKLGEDLRYDFKWTANPADYGNAPPQKPKDRPLKKSEIYSMWCIVALSHDLGLPLEKMSNINEAVENMLEHYGKLGFQDFVYNPPLQHQFMNDFILRFISSKVVFYGLLQTNYAKDGDQKDKTSDNKDYREFRTHVQSKYYLKFLKAFESYEHGVASSLILMKNLVYFLESDFDLDLTGSLSYEDARQFFIRREMLRAISSHSCDNIYHLYTDTLSFLLLVSDEMQSWGRATFSQFRESEKSSAEVYLVNFDKERIHFGFRLSGELKPEDNQQYVKHTFRKLDKVLRTAVDSDSRGFELTFSILGRNDFYEFYHGPDMIRGFLNNSGWDFWED